MCDRKMRCLAITIRGKRCKNQGAYCFKTLCYEHGSLKYGFKIFLVIGGILTVPASGIAIYQWINPGDNSKEMLVINNKIESLGTKFETALANLGLNNIQYLLNIEEFSPEIRKLVLDEKYSEAKEKLNMRLEERTKFLDKIKDSNVSDLLQLSQVFLLELNIEEYLNYVEKAYKENPSNLKAILAYTSSLSTFKKEKLKSVVQNTLANVKNIPPEIHATLKLYLVLEDCNVPTLLFLKQYYVVWKALHDGATSTCEALNFKNCPKNEQTDIGHSVEKVTGILNSCIESTRKVEMELVEANKKDLQYIEALHVTYKLLTVMYLIQGDPNLSEYYREKLDQILTRIAEEYSPWTATLYTVSDLQIDAVLNPGFISQGHIHAVFDTIKNLPDEKFNKEEFSNFSVSEARAFMNASAFIALGLSYNQGFRLRRGFEMAVTSLENVKNPNKLLQLIHLVLLMGIHELYKEENFPDEKLNNIESKIEKIKKEIPVKTLNFLIKNNFDKNIIKN